MGERLVPRATVEGSTQRGGTPRAGRARFVLPVVIALTAVLVADGVPTPVTAPAAATERQPSVGERWNASAAPVGGAARTGTAGSEPSAAPVIAPASLDAIRPECRGPAGSIAIADALLADRYTLSPHRTVTLPHDPTWGEDPLHSTNWQFKYHSLRFVLALTTAWAETGDARYIDRASFLLEDWYRSNPRDGAPSIWAWDEHSTAWRAIVYVCAAEVLPRTSWLANALLLHGRTLADPDFYRGEGNHALNQDIGLLEVGCLLGRSDWMRLADDRLTTLVQQSVDASGATNEQSVFYELYNYQRYREGMERLAECGQVVGPAFDRVALMPTFLANATRPDGTYVPLGDTVPDPATPISGTVAEFAATGGASGPRPTGTSRVYGAGFAFARTGWGESRPFADETLLTVRFGPARRFHGHRDGTSITLDAFGDEVLLDSGQGGYEAGPYRSYFVGRSAHNVVMVDRARRTDRATALRWKRSSASMFEVALAGHPYRGVTAQRRVTFSRALGYVVVEDRVTASTATTFRQLWHLRPGSAPVVSGRRTWTTSPRSNVLIVQVVTPAATRIVTGATSPIQGWVSHAYGERTAAPVVESRRSGTATRFLTVLVPFETRRPAVSVRDVETWSGGYRMTVVVDGKAERIVAGTTASRITPLP